MYKIMIIACQLKAAYLVLTRIYVLVYITLHSAAVLSGILSTVDTITDWSNNKSGIGDSMIIIGEKINSSRKQVSDAIASRDSAFIQKEARAQEEAGANYIDVNTATFAEKEADCLKWMIEAVQNVSDLPLCIDSPNPDVIGEVISLTEKPPMINSITLEPERLNSILSLVLDYKATVIGLCQTENQMGKTATEKVDMAGSLVEKVTAAGIDISALYIDPLVFPVGADQKSTVATLDAIEEIMKRFQGVHTVCGLTNVSHGLPERSLVNRTFLVAAIARGLDSAILNPTDTKILGALRAASMLMGKDEFCIEYIKSFRKGLLA
jgi:5-methyltetrahydrofolate corrinoid/iron sulfur protein methyltransferase